MDSITRGERAEKDLDTFIERRDTHRRQTEGERLEEELYEPSVRAYFARLEEERRLSRLEFHEAHAARLRNTLEALIAHHEGEAEKYRHNGHHHEEGA